jgi:hypothetical protein
VFLLSGTAFAQSTLNFATRRLAGITVTNTTPTPADVKFTLYNSDGSLATAGLNPVSRLVPAKGQIAVFPSEIFGMKEGPREDTWVQATSSMTGLQGFYFSGDFSQDFDGAEAAEPQLVQDLPYIPDNSTGTTLLVTNPSSQTAGISISFYDGVGSPVATTEGQFQVAPHAQLAFPARRPGVSARVSADVGVLVTAIQQSSNSLVLINGQGPKAQALRFVAPYYENDGTIDSRLILNNPTNAVTDVVISMFTDFGQPTQIRRFTLTPNGSTELDWMVLTGSLILNPHKGWLLIEATSPIGGLMLVTSENSKTALPLQATASDRMLFSRFADSDFFNSTLSLVGSAEGAAQVTITLSRADGSTLGRRDLTIPPLFRTSGRIRDLVPISDSEASGYVTIQSSIAINAVELMSGSGGLAQAAVSSQKVSAGFQPGAVVSIPRILGIEELTSTNPGVRRIRITTENVANNGTLYVNGRVVPMTPLLSVGDQYVADLPASLDPGLTALKIRVSGVDSKVELLESGVPGSLIRRQGQAMYQKVEVTEAGLDPSRIVAVPIRNARVEVFDPQTDRVLSVAETDDQGWFLIGVPNLGGLTLRVVSRLRSADVRVLDNTAANRPPYILAKTIDDPGNTAEILNLIDTTRQAGAFNILDDVQRGNAFAAQADSQFVPPPLTIYWSQNNDESVLSKLTGGLIKTTFFNLATNTAYVLGDRGSDSDEFDDSVILHEYAHMLAARFSRDDSPGGPHMTGDTLDPRLAWSEGWANFFSAAVRGTATYLDSKGPGVPSVRFDLEDNVPPGDRPGYWSEASVGGLLWDLVDENADKDDLAQLPFASIWAAFTDLRNVRYVYLPFFLESFLARNPGSSEALRTMVVARSIDFQPEVRPSVVNPFPRPIGTGLNEFKQGRVDSLTSRRTNLSNSAHFYSFTTTGGTATITLNIEGLGGGNPNSNDLDLFLYDGNGRRLEISDRALNGQPELINLVIPAGTYYLEVRSFYLLAETGTMVFNAGDYRLTVQIQ